LTIRRKLIEVALPLEVINVASAREKSIRHGHPSTLHLWWARRPLATCRAVLFASLVDDPSSSPDHFPTLKAQEAERRRLFDIIERLVQWENTTNEPCSKKRVSRSAVLRATTRRGCWIRSVAAEAFRSRPQRLGLEAYGSDLNPVAVLITKALVEIPPRFSNCLPCIPMPVAAWALLVPGAVLPDYRQTFAKYGAWMRKKPSDG